MVEPAQVGRPEWEWGAGASPGCSATFIVLSPTPVSPGLGHLAVPAHLLSLQGELDEDLLQLLVDKVDAELLKAVFLPGRKSVLSSEG